MEYNIYIKLTNDCNLKCQHCYNAIMCNKSTMSDDVIAKCIAWLKQFSATKTDDVLNVQLHGGEPMLIDLDKLNQLVDECQAPNIKWGITTNLAYSLDDAKISFFRKMLPYDDTPFIMTSWDHEIRFSNFKQEYLWTHNVKFLQSNGIEVQPIVCITKNLVQKYSPYQLLTKIKKLGSRNINFERLTRTGRAEDGKLCPTNRQVDDWLFDAYIDAKDLEFNVPLFELIEDSVNGFMNGCRARHCMETVITINPDGSISTCPNCANRIVGNLDVSKINRSHLDEKDTLVKFEKTRNQKCYMCSRFKYCNGDCCQLSYDDSGCPGLTKIYDYLLDVNNHV